MRALILGILRVYRLLFSPWMGNQCRFYPTCSHYAEQAIVMHGVTRGVWLGVRRIMKCHPWHPGGFDHVPAPVKNRAENA